MSEISDSLSLSTTDELNYGAEWLYTASWLCAIIYAVLFGGSLTFQIFVNYQNQSTKGFSTDYALSGFVGFFFLLLNQTIGKIDPTTDAGRIHIMDLAFAQSAFICSSIAYTQTLIYPSHNCLKSTKIAIGVVCGFFFAAATLECLFSITLKSLLGISLINLAAYIKAGSSLFKYLFQIRENFINKSTEGVSKAGFWTDFLGGLFCFMQLQIDARIAGYPSFIADPQLNLAKSLIAIFGLVNTSIILIQIHCIYPGLPRQRMVHLDSTFGSDCEDDNYIDEGVRFENWNASFDGKNLLKEPTLFGDSNINVKASALNIVQEASSTSDGERFTRSNSVGMD